MRGAVRWNGFQMGKTRRFGNHGILPNLELLSSYLCIGLTDRMTVSWQVSSRFVQKKRIGSPKSKFCFLTVARRIGLFEAVLTDKVRISVLSSIALNIPIQIWSIPLTVEMSLWWETAPVIQAILWWGCEMGVSPKHRVCWHTRQSAISDPNASEAGKENHGAEPYLAYTAAIKCCVQS